MFSREAPVTGSSLYSFFIGTEYIGLSYNNESDPAAQQSTTASDHSNSADQRFLPPRTKHNYHYQLTHTLSYQCTIPGDATPPITPHQPLPAPSVAKWAPYTSQWSQWAKHKCSFHPHSEFEAESNAKPDAVADSHSGPASEPAIDSEPAQIDRLCGESHG